MTDYATRQLLRTDPPLSRFEKVCVIVPVVVALYFVAQLLRAVL
jgi:hypothetical protein